MLGEVNITIFDILISVANYGNVKLKDDVLLLLSNESVLDENEIAAINTFKKLCNDVNGVPKSNTLASFNIEYQSSNLIQENSIEDYTKIFVKKKSILRMQQVLVRASSDITNKDANVDNVIDDTTQQLAQYRSGIANEDIVSNLDLEFYKDLTENNYELNGVPFGLNDIDNIHPGIVPNSITVLAGYTGSMKTTLAANIAYTAITQGKNVLYVSLEVSKTDLTYNLLSRHTMSYNGESKTRDEIKVMAQSEKDKFMEIAEDYNKLPGKLRIVDESDINGYTQASFTALFNTINKELIEKTEHGFDILVIDHMQLLKFDENHRKLDPYQVVNNFASFFRQYTVKNGIATILVSQTSRDGYKRAKANGGRYEVTGLAEANELERAATCVITLFVDEALKTSGEIQVQLIKSRNSMTQPDPSIVGIKPEYYFIGSTGGISVQKQAPVFTNKINSYNNFQEQSVDLDSILGL